MSPLLVSGLFLGVLGAATPLLLRLSGVGWLRLVSVPLATALFATSFTLAARGPLLPPLAATAGRLIAHAGAARVSTPPARLAVPEVFSGERPAFSLGLSPGVLSVGPAAFGRLRAGDGLGPAGSGLHRHGLRQPRRTKGAF